MIIERSIFTLSLIFIVLNMKNVIVKFIKRYDTRIYFQFNQILIHTELKIGSPNAVENKLECIRCWESVKCV